MDNDIDAGTHSAAVPPPDRTPAPASRDFRQPVLFVLAGLALLWATWATHSICEIKRASPHIVKVQLAGLVQEYVQAQARSGASADQVSAQTTAYLKALNETVSAHAHAGTVVLLANAVVDGAVPDITMTVRQEVYARVPHPQPGQPQGMTPQMKQFFDANGAANGNGK